MDTMKKLFNLERLKWQLEDMEQKIVNAQAHAELFGEFHKDTANYEHHQELLQVLSDKRRLRYEIKDEIKALLEVQPYV